jgi:DNA-binding NarL/FixJ family response regulator
MMTKTEPSTSRRAIKVVLIDDHPIVRAGLKDLIANETDILVCGEAGSISQALSVIEEQRPDVAVVDLTLGNESGLDLVKDITARWPDVHVLVLSMHDESFYAERILRAGALGYVNKSEPGEKLIKAIRRASGGQAVLSSATTVQFLRRAAGGAAPVKTGVANLSDRELQVFELVGAGLSSRDIATQLNVSVKTVESHLEHIKVKLDVSSGRELVRRATMWVEGNHRAP